MNSGQPAEELELEVIPKLDFLEEDADGEDSSVTNRFSRLEEPLILQSSSWEEENDACPMPHHERFEHDRLPRCHQPGNRRRERKTGFASQQARPRSV